MKKSNQTYIFLLFFLWAFGALAQDIAFPGALGWASATPGGRGGKIIRVTSLNGQGPGSFLEAVTSTEPRIVVFEVGGIVDLKGQIITIRSPFLTIAGQTAPSPGITFIDGGINIQTHDVIVQHIRLRQGASRHVKGWEPDAMAAISAYNVVIDHCSFSWGVDENCSASGPRFKGENVDEWRKNTSHSITMSNNIIAEGLSNSTHPKGEHSKGTLIHDNATDIAIVGNLYASNRDRNALFKGGARGIYVNNYIQNPGRNAIRYGLVDEEWQGYPHQTGQVTIVGNVMQHGPSSSDMPMMYAGNGPCEIYMEDNIAKNKLGLQARLFFGDTLKIRNEKPVWFAGIKPIKASEVKKSIVKNAGARPWDRDEHDKRFISEMLSNSGKVIDSETQVGGYPASRPTNKKFVEKDWDLKYMTKK
ncbi:pectate lyase family protein [Dyadobacter psychrotolerans]|uniref:Pectate lyase n=1 Tax=Dyadobacter psychrotolerans TaxID=2541721 RepID=A0A4R5DMP4_9BACT|nr:pectate lyase [Dyadobacter psychrotolerans]TDE15419.1 pectate lyase [Dyadobacter psychrotolerans]